MMTAQFVQPAMTGGVFIDTTGRYGTINQPGFIIDPF